MMEQNQLLQLSMDPNLTPAWKEAVNNALNKSMLNTAMAFGGADITKEQKAAWELENKQYRQAQGALYEPLSPGTRVYIRPLREQGALERHRGYYGHMPQGGDSGVVVTPGTPEAGQWGDSRFEPRWSSKNPPTLDHVAVRGEGSPWWFWRHRNDLEVLPPLEKFPVGTKVQWEYRGKTWTGTVGEIPRSGHDKEYWHDQKKHIWIDTDVGPDEKPLGGWLPPEWLTKRGK